MSDAVMISLVVAACALVNAGIVFATFWINRGTQEGSLRAKVDQALRDAATAAALAGKAQIDHDKLSRELSDYREDQAGKYAMLKVLVEVQVTSLTAAENRIAKSLDEMRASVDEKIDSVRDSVSDLHRRLDRTIIREHGGA